MLEPQNTVTVPSLAAMFIFAVTAENWGEYIHRNPRKYYMTAFSQLGERGFSPIITIRG